MLKVFVLEVTADARQRILDELQVALRAPGADLSLLPRVDLRPVSRQELRFQEEPDVLVVGDGITREYPADLAELRKQYPNLGIMVRLPREQADLATIEQLARLGVDDTLIAAADGHEVMRKLVILGRRRRKQKPGQFIVVDGGKGGVGTTSISAAVAEALALAGKKVVLVDFDCESQDLSRYLQAAPFVNENLQLLLDQQRPLTEEFALQCVGQVFDLGKGSLACVAPPPETETLYSSGASYSRVYISFFELLDSKFDAVVVDAGSARGAILKTLYRVADSLVFVLSNDPACLYSAAERLTRFRGLLSPQANLVPVLNAVQKQGLAPDILKKEFSEAVGVPVESWSAFDVPEHLEASRWPGSGGTLYDLGHSKVRRAISSIVERLGFGTLSASPKRPEVLAGARELLARLFQSACAVSQRKTVTKQGGTAHSLPTKVVATPQLGEPLLRLPQNTQAAVNSLPKNLPTDETASEAQEEKLVSGARFI
jgi:MinD-like ATPase involved in chromosome partitioning or flagellar assembly